MTKKYFKTFSLLAIVLFTNTIYANENPVSIANECSDCKVEVNEVSFEENKDMEEWMTSKEFWLIEPNLNILEDSQTIDQEEDLEIEEWMLDFSILSNTVNTDERLSENEIESWMLDDVFWKIKIAPNDELVLQDWMFNTDFWTI